MTDPELPGEAQAEREESRIRVAVCVSRRGTNLRSLVEAAAKAAHEPVVAVADRAPVAVGS